MEDAAGLPFFVEEMFAGSEDDATAVVIGDAAEFPHTLSKSAFARVTETLLAQSHQQLFDALVESFSLGAIKCPPEAEPFGTDAQGLDTACMMSRSQHPRDLK